MKRNRWTWAITIGVNALFLCVLSFYRTTEAQTPANPIPPFANSVQQRQDIVEQLKQTNQLLKEQNDLLRSGQVRVIINKDPQ